ncbi:MULTISPECIES: hypothetical protein [unclassified Mycolicibacterium]
MGRRSGEIMCRYSWIKKITARAAPAPARRIMKQFRAAPPAPAQQ